MSYEIFEEIDYQPKVTDEKTSWTVDSNPVIERIHEDVSCVG